MAGMLNELITQQITILFDGLNRLHHALFKSGRRSESDEVTIMALRLRQIAAGEPAPVDDPRPSDPAELARMTAIELRKRMSAMAYGEMVIVASVEPARTGYRASLVHYDLAHEVFGKLGPIGCADEIQQQEVARAKQWAGDT